jgi:hypothetical protein
MTIQLKEEGISTWLQHGSAKYLLAAHWPLVRLAPDARNPQSL